MKIFLAVFFLLLCIQVSVAQQNNGDIAAIEKHISGIRPEHPNSFNQKKTGFVKSKNPASLILYSLLFIYQKAVSEQISAVCEFNPSCSHFSIDAIKKYGLVKGICLTTDRLTRCNGLAQIEAEGFLINHHNGKVNDAASYYHFKN